MIKIQNSCPLNNIKNFYELYINIERKIKENKFFNYIKIAFITDNEFIKATLVAIYSLLKNKNLSSKYLIYVIGYKLSFENILLLNRLLLDKVDIKVINIKNINNYTRNKTSHVSPNATIKFNLPNILGDISKVLYIDSDVLILKDLAFLYSIDLTHYYAAMVKDYGALFWPKHYKERLDIKHEYYFNSGLMLLNIENLRKDNICGKLHTFKNFYKTAYMDQDAINVVMGKKILCLPFMYNFMINIIDTYKKQDIERFYEIEISNEFKKDIVMLHFASKFKPWLEGSENIWKKYARDAAKSMQLDSDFFLNF